MVLIKDKTEDRNNIQYKALNAWASSGMHGTVEMSTGLGKTFVALHALYRTNKDVNLVNIFLAEVNDRYDDLLEQISLYKIIFKRDVLKDYNLKFMCYQSACKLKGYKFGLVIADEIHDSLTPAYSQFYFNNTYNCIIGLSAKINRDIRYTLPDDTIKSKGQYLDEICPIIFSYQLKESIDNNTSRNLKVHIIYNELDTLNKYIRAGNSTKEFYQTEYTNYSYWNNRFNKCQFMSSGDDQDREYITTSNRRKTLLYNLRTKVNIVKYLLQNLKNRTIVFANSLDFLYEITQNVVSNRNTTERNNQIRKWLSDGDINVIGSFKKLKQGANLSDDLDNCIIASYFTSSVDLEQRIGRLRDNGTQGNVFIIVTKNTQEEVWFNTMIKDIRSSLNMIYHKDIHDCIKYLNKK